MRLFVTGTDTGVGKTVVSAILHRAFATWGYVKPIATGDDDDVAEVARLSGNGRVVRGMHLKRPAAPSRAAAEEGVHVTVADLARRVPEGDWIVEGAGGLLVPLNHQETILDLIGALHSAAFLVSSTRLGTINHTLLSLRCLAAAGVRVAGMALVGPEDPGLAETLSDFTDVPVVLRVPHVPEVTPAAVRRWAEALAWRP